LVYEVSDRGYFSVDPRNASSCTPAPPRDDPHQDAVNLEGSPRVALTRIPSSVLVPHAHHPIRELLGTVYEDAVRQVGDLQVDRLEVARGRRRQPLLRHPPAGDETESTGGPLVPRLRQRDGLDEVGEVERLSQLQDGHVEVDAVGVEVGVLDDHLDFHQHPAVVLEGGAGANLQHGGVLLLGAVGGGEDVDGGDHGPAAEVVPLFLHRHLVRGLQDCGVDAADDPGAELFVAATVTSKKFSKQTIDTCSNSIHVGTGQVMG
jgi:hypothetical protein